MSERISARHLQPGDFALTDFNKGATRVRIVARRDGQRSQSGVMFQVDPPMRNHGPATWIDADWFEPAPKESP